VISPLICSTFDLPRDLLRRAKITAVNRGSSVRDLVIEAVHVLMAEASDPRRQRMTEAPIKLRPGHTIPIRLNSELAQSGFALFATNANHKE
jgi:hypothetical protein